MTKTKDEQDRENPYKPFPKYEYFWQLYAAWLAESILLVEKSRTMMLTWFFAGLCLHHAMTNPASKVIFWGPDEDRALQPLDYAWTLWENQDQQLKGAWPLDRPRERQAYMKMELANDSVLVALPGKDPDRIRKDHPTIVFFDEAAIIERFEESEHDEGRETRPVAVSNVATARLNWADLGRQWSVVLGGYMSGKPTTQMG